MRTMEFVGTCRVGHELHVYRLPTRNLDAAVDDFRLIVGSDNGRGEEHGRIEVMTVTGTVRQVQAIGLVGVQLQIGGREAEVRHRNSDFLRL